MSVTESAPIRKARFGRIKPKHKTRATEDKLEILELLVRFETVRTSFIKALLPHRRPGGVSDTLTILHNDGLVEKPSQQRLYNDKYDADIYAVTKAGVDLLSDSERFPEMFVNNHRPKGYGTRIMFPHRMMICDSASNYYANTIDADCSMISLSQILERRDEAKWNEILSGFNFKGRKKTGLEKNPTALPFNITYEHPVTGKIERSGDDYAIPDLTTGFKYSDGSAIFTAHEEQNTSGLSPSSQNKKHIRSSTMKKLLSFDYILEYKTYLHLVPNLHVIFRYGTEERMNNAIELAKELFGKHKDLLFTCEPSHSVLLQAPQPAKDLLTREYLRAGLPPVRLYTPDKSKLNSKI